MFTVAIYTAEAEIREQDEIDALVWHLGENGYLGVLREALRGVVIASGTDLSAVSIRGIRRDPFFQGPHAETAVGDAFFQKSSVFVLQPTGRVLTVMEIRHHTAPPAIDEFTRHLEAGARVRLDGRRFVE